MLRTLFAPVDFLCLYHAASIFFKEEFVLTAEWPVAIICTVTSLLARVVINFSMLASLSSGSLWSYVTDADGTTKLTLALTDTPSSAAYAYILRNAQLCVIPDLLRSQLANNRSNVFCPRVSQSNARV